MSMDILIKPIVTEKMSAQGEEMNRYGFIVNKQANKIEIKEAIEKAYGVTAPGKEAHIRKLLLPWLKVRLLIFTVIFNEIWQ